MAVRGKTEDHFGTGSHCRYPFCKKKREKELLPFQIPGHCKTCGKYAVEEDAYETICDYTEDSDFAELKKRIKNKGKGGANMIEALHEILEDQKKAGYGQGYGQGIEQGESRLSDLLSRLLDSGRYEDVERTVRDKEYRKELMKKYGL